jgi:hypothetical protein
MYVNNHSLHVVYLQLGCCLGALTLVRQQRHCQPEGEGLKQYEPVGVLRQVRVGVTPKSHSNTPVRHWHEMVLQDWCIHSTCCRSWRPACMSRQAQHTCIRTAMSSRCLPTSDTVDKIVRFKPAWFKKVYLICRWSIPAHAGTLELADAGPQAQS